MHPGRSWCWPPFGTDVHQVCVLETTISRLADGTAVRQTIAGPKQRRLIACSSQQALVQDRGSVCRQDAAHSGARLQRLVHGAFAAQWPRALMADVGAVWPSGDTIYWCASSAASSASTRAVCLCAGGETMTGAVTSGGQRTMVGGSACTVSCSSPRYHSPPERGRAAAQAGRVHGARCTLGRRSLSARMLEICTYFNGWRVPADARAFTGRFR